MTTPAPSNMPNPPTAPTTPVVHDEPHQDDLTKKKSPSFGKKFGIYIFFLIVIIGAILALVSTGYVGAYQYDTVMWTIVLLFNLILMAWPAYLAGKLVVTKPQHWVLNLAFRGGVIVASVIYTVFLFPIVILTQGDLGSKLWSVPFFGPIILPLGAVVLHTVAAWLLTRYAVTNPTLAEDKAALPRLEEKLKKAKKKRKGADEKHAAKDAAVKDQKSVYETAASNKKAASERFETATKEFKESDLVTSKGQTDKELSENKTNRTNMAEATEALERLIKSTNPGPVLEDRKKDLAKLNADNTELGTERDRLEKRAKDQAKEIDESADKTALDALKVAADTTSEEEVVERKRLEEAQSVRDTAALALATAGHMVKNAQDDLDKKQQSIVEAQKASSALWRDLAFSPAISLVLLLVTFSVLYPTWYGWVIVTVVV